MKFDMPLTDLYKLYQMGDLRKKDFEGRIYQYLLDNFKRYQVFRGNRDKWNEFLSWLYPRLTRAIELYKDQGSSFDAYIFSLIHCTCKEYRCREADHYITECACWQAKVEEMKLSENEPEYLDGRRKFLLPDGINPRHILFLLLKSYCFVTEDFVKKAAKAIGMDTEIIWRMIEELRRMRSEREEEILELRERLYCQYYRCLAYQKRMNDTLPGTNYHIKMKDRFERARKRYFAMKKRLNGIRMSATNRMIATVAGVPKGTVDTALSVIKNRMSFIPDGSAWEKASS